MPVVQEGLPQVLSPAVSEVVAAPWSCDVGDVEIQMVCPTFPVGYLIQFVRFRLQRAISVHVLKDPANDVNQLVRIVEVFAGDVAAGCAEGSVQTVVCVARS